jgi:hypothetical protein
MKYIYKLQKFMMGRYGIDDLYKFLLRLYLIIFIVDIFINSKILTIIELIIVVIMFYRFFSKNIYSRQKENKIYLKIKSKMLKPFNNLKRNFKDRDYYVYKKCRHCKKILKLPLPKRRGIQHVKCPKCKNKIKFLVLRQEKIDVIKKRK